MPAHPRRDILKAPKTSKTVSPGISSGNSQKGQTVGVSASGIKAAERVS
jgi:hypothetical protein